MNTNSYRNVVPTWQAELVVRRARRMGFRTGELADLQQRIVPHLAAFQFDATRANGAAPRTALVALIDQQLKAVARASARYRRHLQRWHQVTPRCQLVVSGDNMALTFDVQQALSMLPARERAVCDALATGASLADIAAQLHCSWHVVRRLVRNIRARFAALGLGDWIGA